MIEATCAACGTVARIAEVDVPTGAKFVNCASCKARVALPASRPTVATPAKGIKPVPIPAIPPRPPAPAVPPPATSRSATTDLADLPAPKRSSPLAGTESPSKPPPRSGLADAELPVPKGAKPPTQGPGAVDLDDLMAPKGKSGLAGLADLPAPKAKRQTPADLPAPKPKAPSALADLPAPKARGNALADLPAPKAKPGGAPTALDIDLDLPAPKDTSTDVAPKGFFDDLPQPAKPSGATAPTTGIELPAPKGFFDDLPQPKAGTATDLAPKGFFDDLPQPTKPAATDVAPKGFFDDLPQPAKSAGTTDVAPKGFFDDLPQPTKPSGDGGGAGLFDDLPEGSALINMPLGAGDLDLGPASGSLELDSPGGFDAPPSQSGGGFDGPDLDLGLPLGQDATFKDLDLSEPSKPAAKRGSDPDSPIKIKTPAKGATPSPIAINVPKAPGELKLDLAEDPHAAHGAAPAAAAAGGTVKIAPKKRVLPEESAEAVAKKKKRTRIVLAAVLGVSALGAGGFYFYQRHAKAKAREEEIANQLATARSALVAADANHWSRASSAASAVLEIAPNNVRALGLAAEASIAGALDNGINGENQIKKGRAHLQAGLGAGSTAPELDRAQAIAAIASNQPERAIPKLTQLAGATPKDPFLPLYIGWAQLVKGDGPAAIKAFDQSIAAGPAAKVPALYGKARAQLMMADLAAAAAAFGEVLAADKEHVCAQVGLAATLPPAQSSQREADLNAILNRKDLAKADPRCLTQSHTLLGDGARAAGRLDIAREHYRKALALSKTDVAAHTGLAQVELRDGKLQIAADLIQKALATNANDPGAQLVSAELMVVEGKLPDAQKTLDALAARQPPLPPLLAARMHVVKGKHLEAQGKVEDAITAYIEGAKLAGDLDLTPTMAAVTKLADLAKKAPDEATAKGYRDRADQLLQALAERAQEDPYLSANLGVAYLLAGDATKAEVFLQRSVTMRGDDPEARLQLAKALLALGRGDDAIAQLKEAQALDGKRLDITLQLARAYEAAGKDQEAIDAYSKLLTLPDVPNVVRVAAGRFFAKKGLIDKASAEAEPILATEPENPGGLYLKSEGLMKAGKFDEARMILNRATEADPEAQYLDALGRAFEGSLKASGDTKYIEGARHAYERASAADPKLFNPLVGQGRMLVRRLDFEPALKPLVAAAALDPGSSEVMFYTGMAYFGLRNQGNKVRATAAQWLEAALVKGKPELDLERRAEAAKRLSELYVDLNKAPNAASSMAVALKLGEGLEKEGKAPDWLTELYYEAGDMYYRLGDKRSQKLMFQKYVERKPKNEARFKDAQTKLATELQRY